ncbi:MAG: peptidoglycan-binding protein [Patescibacteria group bacterium]|nr:peptidoglycan-binding protein [Patescibacteria group bacterium]
MSRFFLTIFLSLAVPALAFAATTDFTANGDITVSSVTFGSGTANMLILNGSTAQSWSFSSGAFTVTNAGTFKVGSADSSVKSIQFSSGGTTLVCSENTTPGTSFATAPTAAGTYTITPSATTQCTSLCSAVSNAASYNSFPTCGAASCNAGYTLSGSGSSATCVAVGGGGIIVPCGPGYTLSGGLCYPTGTKPATAGAAQTGGQPNSPAQTAYTYTRDLTIGDTGADVAALQKFLIDGGYTIPAGPTGYFGQQTRVALAKYQKTNDINPSAGYFGPLTRASIVGSAVSATGAQGANAISTSYQFARNLQLSDRGKDVRQLQTYLNAHGFTLAQNGPGSLGSETDYFGAATLAALVKFQNAHAGEILAPAGLTQGTGYFGESTRAYVNTH